MVEQGTENPRVGGSSPPLPTILTFAWVAELEDAGDLKSSGGIHRVGSSPTSGTKKNNFF